MPEINTANVFDATEKIKVMASAVSEGETSWQNLFDTLPKGEKHFAQLGQQMERQIITEEGVIQANQQARASALAHNEAIKAQTLSAKDGSVALKALSIAGNMLAAWAITKVISLAATGIDKLVHSAEYAEKAFKAATDSAKSFSQAIKDIQKDTVDMEKSVDSIIDRYAKLSQGVNSFTNENNSLSTDEYEEFLDLNKQLARLFPSLTRNYDENSNAILGLSGSVDSVTESIKALVEQEKELAKGKIRENLEQYFNGTDEADGAWKALEGKKKALEEINSKQEKLTNAYNTLINSNKKISLGTFSESRIDYEKEKYVEYFEDNFGKDIAKAVEKAIFFENTYDRYGDLDISDIYGDLVVDFSQLELTEKQKEQITSSYDTFYNELSAEQKTAMSELDLQNSEFSNNAMLWLEDLAFYKDSNKYVQLAMQNLVRSIDWSNYDAEQLDYDGVKRIIQDSVLTPFQVACDNPDTKKKLDETFASLFTLDISDMPVNEARLQIDSYMKTIAAALGTGEDPVELKARLDFDGVFDDVDDTYNRLKNSIFKLSTDDNEILDNVEEIEQGASKVFQNVKEAFRTIKPINSDEYAKLLEYTEDFTQAQVEIWLEATSGATSAAEAIQMYEDKLTETAEAMTSFEDAWANSFTSENEAVKNLGNTLLDLAEKGRLTIETFNNTDSTDYFKNLGISAEEAVAKINKLVDESSQLSSMSNQFSKMSEALGTKRDDGFVSADTLSGFDAEVRGLDSWDRFQEVLGSTTSSYDECRGAANALATEWINNSDFLAQLTEQNKEYYETQLQAMGIENYEEIIAYAQDLNAAKEALSQASFDLATATSEEIQALIADGEYTELAEQQIWALILAKQTEEGLALNTSADCQNLLNLAKNAGVTGDAITLLTRLMNIYNNIANGVYGNNYHAIEDAKNQAEDLKNRINRILANGTNDTVKVSPKIEMSPASKSSASSAGKSAGEDAGKSAGEAFTDALDKELAALDKKMEAGYIDFNDYIQARLALIEDYYNQGKLSADEYYSYLEKHYDTQLSYMDKVVNAVTRRIDKEIDALKQQKEDVENIYKVQIESLEKEKTLLEEANKARQRQVDLQKSLYDLERARNQRTKLVYSEDEGMHYIADDDSIRSAQQEVDNAGYDIKISEFEKSISNLEDARDKETDAIEEMISNLEAYKDAWNDVTSAYEEEQENLFAAQILGADWEADILNSRLDVLNDFKNEYMSIQQAMVDAAWKSANELKAAKEAEKGASGSTSKAPKINGNNDIPKTDPSQFPKKSGGGGRFDYISLQAYASGTNNAKKGLNLVGEDGPEAYFDNRGHVAIVTKPTLIPMEGGEVVKNERDTKKLLDPDNLASVDTIGLADFDEKDAGFTIKVFPDGRALTPISREDYIRELLQKAPVLSKQVRAEQVYPETDLLQGPERCAAAMERSLESMMNPMNLIAHNMQKMTSMDKHIDNVSSAVNNNRDIQQPVNNTFNITMPNVTNATSAERLMNDLQSLGRKKFQVDWNK